MSTVPPQLAIRPYERADAEATLAVFTDAITRTAAKHYTPEQVQAWARPGERDAEDWHISMSGRNGFVATIWGEVVGFSDVDERGRIDTMFVAPRHQGLGVARAMLAEAERRAREQLSEALTAEVSITARPFFERHGFSVESRQEAVRRGVRLVNYRMRKPLLPVSA